MWYNRNLSVVLCSFCFSSLPVLLKIIHLQTEMELNSQPNFSIYSHSRSVSGENLLKVFSVQTWRELTCWRLTEPSHRRDQRVKPSVSVRGGREEHNGSSQLLFYSWSLAALAPQWHCQVPMCVCVCMCVEIYFPTNPPFPHAHTHAHTYCHACTNTHTVHCLEHPLCHLVLCRARQSICVCVCVYTVSVCLETEKMKRKTKEICVCCQYCVFAHPCES